MDGWMVSWVHVCTVARTRSHSLTLHRFPGLWLARRSVWGLVSCSQWQREGERDRKVTDQLCLRWFEQGAQCSDIWRIRYFYVVFFLLVFFLLLLFPPLLQCPCPTTEPHRVGWSCHGSPQVNASSLDLFIIDLHRHFQCEHRGREETPTAVKSAPSGGAALSPSFCRCCCCFKLSVCVCSSHSVQNRGSSLIVVGGGGGAAGPNSQVNRLLYRVSGGSLPSPDCAAANAWWAAAAAKPRRLREDGGRRLEVAVKWSFCKCSVWW